MADKIFGVDYTDETNPTGSETISVYQAGVMKDVRLDNVVAQVTHNATEQTTPANTDEFSIWNGVTHVLNKITWANIKVALNAIYDWATVVHGAAAKTTPVDADEFGIIDTAASNVLKKVTWANVKATFMTALGGLIAALTAKTSPAVADKFAIADSAASNATKYLAISDFLTMLDKNYIRNYVITPSVASNNLTIAIKTIAGADPSSTDPVIIRVGDVLYRITSAQSFTKNAGTNWLNAGSSELAAHPIDFFLYAINETGASAGIKFGFARRSDALTMGDFTNTSTSEDYIAGNWTNFNATDAVSVIGRFRAQLSATAAFNWSIATQRVVNYPIFETDWLDWTPTPSASGSMTYTSVTINLAQYRIKLYEIEVMLDMTGTTGGVASLTLIATSPFVAVGTLDLLTGQALDTITGTGFAWAASTALNIRKVDSSAWGLGTGRVARCKGTYKI